jgi:hypothetical protein
MYWLGSVEEQAESRQATPTVVAELRMTFNIVSLPIRIDIPRIEVHSNPIFSDLKGNMLAYALGDFQHLTGTIHKHLRQRPILSPGGAFLVRSPPRVPMGKAPVLAGAGLGSEMPLGVGG